MTHGLFAIPTRDLEPLAAQALTVGAPAVAYRIMAELDARRREVVAGFSAMADAVLLMESCPCR